VLVSEPFLQDTYFKRSLVLLTEFNEEGAVGFVLNKLLDVNVQEVLEDFPSEKYFVSVGGPVNTSSVNFIHTLGESVPNTTHVTGNLWWGGDFEFVKDLIRHSEITDKQIRFFLGYSGWTKGQLENELVDNSWLITEVEPYDIMQPDSNIWKRVLSSLGTKYEIWSNFPENPGQN
jgi:putative transcriptional regulator